MAGVRISQLPADSVALLTDLVPTVQAGVTYKETLQQILTLFNPNIQLSSPSQVTGLGTAAVKNASNNSEPTLSSVVGATVINDLPIFSDIAGSITDSGVLISNVALLTGAIFSGTVTLNGIQSNTNDAATIGYVNSTATGLTIVAAVYAATTANLNATYSNGSSGVGATLTNAGAQAAFSTDGVSPPLNSRILVKNQSAAADNGIYSLTTVGTGATNWVLTRTTDYDTTAQIKPGTLVLVQNGSTLAFTSWLQTLTVTTIGTDPIQFTQFSASPSSLGQAAFKNVTNNAQPLVVSISGATVIGNIAVFSDTAGTISDSGFSSLTAMKSVKTQIFTSSGSYIPSTNLIVAYVEECGAGGGSGGAQSSTGQGAASGGGQAGGYNSGWFTAATIGVSQIITIGAAGTAGTSSTAGGNGGQTSFGALLTADGGAGSINVGPVGGPNISAGGSGLGTTSTGAGIFAINGQIGENGYCILVSFAFSVSGNGGSNPLGQGGIGVQEVTAISVPGNVGTGYGAGASGAAVSGTGGAAAGAAGTQGIIKIYEFCGS